MESRSADDSSAGKQKNVPAFLNKLFTMVDDPNSDEFIRWSLDGESFIVPSPERLGKEILPRYFKHNNFGSFVRQLNMYDFHKVQHLQQGVLRSDPLSEPEGLEFRNDNFIRGRKDLLLAIRRKKGTEKDPLSPQPTGKELTTMNGNNSSSQVNSREIDLRDIAEQLAALQKSQDVLSNDLRQLQSSSSALWSEMKASREKNQRYQDTTNKIVSFLAGVFGGRALNANGMEGNIGEIDDYNGQMVNTHGDLNYANFGNRPWTANEGGAFGKIDTDFGRRILDANGEKNNDGHGNNIGEIDADFGGNIDVPVSDSSHMTDLEYPSTSEADVVNLFTNIPNTPTDDFRVKTPELPLQPFHLSNTHDTSNLFLNDSSFLNPPSTKRKKNDLD